MHDDVVVLRAQMQNEPKIAIANEMGDNSILRIATDIASVHNILLFSN